jgi:ATP-dependent DNA helicase DinG
MTTKWVDIFAPVMAQGREVREGQAILGQAIIDAIEKKQSLTAQAGTGTGKSFASLIPLMVQIQKSKKAKKPYRAIVSTETLSLQAQLIDKDLPFLSKLYPGVNYRKLMGRNNYLCFEVARTAALGDMQMHSIVETLKTRSTSLGNGEKQDIEKVLGRELTKEQWDKIASSSSFCPDNQCKAEKCFSTRARDLAKSADLVVVNHAILAVDIEMKGGDALADGMLGQFEALVVDEGHQLEPAFTKAWTKEFTERELEQSAASLIDGIEMAKGLKSNARIGKVVNDAMEDLEDVLANVKKYYLLLNEKSGGEWKGSQTSLSLKYPLGRPSGQLQHAMDEFENENPARLLRAESALEDAVKYLFPVVLQATEDKVKGIRKLRKGYTAACNLLENVKIISKALETKDGIISQYGVYGANVEGWETFKDKKPMMTIKLTPLDVSARAKQLWGKEGGQTNILLSATLTDLTDGTFRYAKECIAFPNGPEVDVNSPFNSQEQQLVYITPANRKDKVDGAQYSFSELMDLIYASRGRALVLFTSRKELDYAAEQMQLMRNMGHFPYTLLVQTKDADKRKLKDEFERDISSVLLATKSFFVGIDIPGESLSLLAMVKWPNERYDSLCKQMIIHWRMRGFSRWYERISLTLFQQASGRLIRSMGCKGVVALLDYRANDSESNVFKTAKMGVDTLRSRVTQDIASVKAFLQ